MESKKINQLATELAPDLSDLTIIGDPTTGISKKITLSQMASLFTGTVEEYANFAAFPLVGVADTIYIALDTNILYRWNTGTSAYVELSPNIVSSLVFNDANGFDGTINLVGSVATLTITTALTTGSVGFIGASGALLQDNANFFWDDTNNRLGLGTNAPTTALDVFGSGIIGRLNGTSTNNAFLGFASAGSNKWSIGNVQSDHRFRIFSETNTSELVSILQTGEFGIGIANPTTKLHIDGGASALIANLDANVSVAKSLSFRSDNSARINLEVSGTESGSNVGADLFIRTFTDAGSLIETPLSIVRSTGVTTIKSLTLTNVLSVANGGTGANSFTSGSILFSNGTAIAQDNSNLFWDDTNNRLGIGIAIPTRTLDVTGTFRVVTPNRNFFITSNAYSVSDGTLSSGFGMDGDGMYLGNVTSSTGWTISNPQVSIRSSGNVGIGTTNPQMPLSVQANTGNGAIRLIGTSNASSNNAGIYWYDSNDSTFNGYLGNFSGSFDIYNHRSTPMVFSTAGTERMRITAGGTIQTFNGATLYGEIFQTGSALGINAYSGALLLQATGTTRMSIFGSGNIRFTSVVYNNTVTSPRTLYVASDGEIGGQSSILASKTNIKQFDTNWLYDLKPVQFNYRKKNENEEYTNEFDTELYYGLIAEETELVNKELCTYKDDKLMGIEYSKLITPILKEIQELKKEIELLKAK
jgi:hypothetical protein